MEGMPLAKRLHIFEHHWEFFAGKVTRVDIGVKNVISDTKSDC